MKTLRKMKGTHFMVSYLDKEKEKLEISKIIKNALKQSPSPKTLNYHFLESETGLIYFIFNPTISCRADV